MLYMETCLYIQYNISIYSIYYEKIFVSEMKPSRVEDVT